jgi:hypothetical protein
MSHFYATSVIFSSNIKQILYLSNLRKFFRDNVFTGDDAWLSSSELTVTLTVPSYYHY